MDKNIIFNNNLSYLKKNQKDIYKSIQTTNTSHIKTDISNNGINVKVGNHYIYPENSSEFLGSKIQNFFEKPTAFMKEPLIFKKDPITTPIQDIYLSKIESKLPPLQSKLQYDKHLDSIPILLLFGIGTGQEIEQLISLVDIKTLVIVDQDFGMIKNSMSIINWKPIFEYFSRDSYSLEFNIEKDPLVAASNIFFTISTKKIHCSCYINYFSTYLTTFFQTVYNNIEKNYYMLFNGWGFYDDDLLSLNHTIENINNNRAIFMGNKSLPKNSSVFIIGTGPSIDKDIENIKKLKDNAIIFSCGTALKVLEANNIIPDYHFESERPPRMYEYIADNISKDYLKQIDFIGVNVIYPKVLTLFKTAKIFFRDVDCGASLVSDDIPKLDHCNPTVVNAAISFAAKIGFKNIYMFGTDMGYRDEENHHSKHSSYSDKNSAISKLKPTTINKSFIGNFDENEKFLSTIVLEWCKQRVERAIHDYRFKEGKFINYYNCSDGIKIEQTIPLKSKDIKLSNIDKKNTLNLIELNFNHDFTKISKDIKSKFLSEKKITIKTIDHILTIINQNNNISTYSTLFEVMDTTYYLIYEKIDNKKTSLTFSLLRGTMLQMYTTIYTFALLSKDIEESFKYINHSFTVVIEFLQLVRSDINKHSFN